MLFSHPFLIQIFQPDLHAVNIRDLTTKVVMPAVAVGLAAILVPVASAIMLIKSGVFGKLVGKC